MTAAIPEEILELSESIAVLVNGGDSIEGAVRRLKKFSAPQNLIDEARRVYEVRVGRIRDLRDPGALVEKEQGYGYWYAGPKDSDLFWPPLKRRLIQNIGDDPVKDIDDSSNRILSLMRPPGVQSIETRGLVLGYVQSGKTTSFMSVLAKAADVGYRLFIVLSGITDNLRSQTQERLEEVLVGDLEQKWHLLTALDEDFQSRGNAANLLGNDHQRLLAVVKKNPYRLRRLVRWLESAGESTMKNCPIIIIDDEADQASIDVGKSGRTSKINGLIGQILRQPKAGYVAYTATPFANLLVNAKYCEGLYPRDFVVDLPRPDTYFGPERIFGRYSLTPEEEVGEVTEGLDVIRYVESHEISDVQPPRGKGAVYSWDPTVPDSLERALRWFLLATAARRVRAVGTQHSSMLIHTTMLAEGHKRLSMPVNVLLERLRQQIANEPQIREELERLWSEESARIPPQDEASTPVTWTEILGVLPEVLAQIRVVVDNYRSTERLSYSGDTPQTAIVIGGNTLSRGLTLEGLVCSYFVRAASAYDTLLQMGRWFGYRRGYGDLVRIWMTPDLESWFFDLATVEEEIRRDIRRYENEDLSPSELAIRIRSHPSMAITSAAKMRHAVKAGVSYGGTRQQTILFDHRDGDWLHANWQAGRSLVRAAIDEAVSHAPAAHQGRYVFKTVSSDTIMQFINEYRFHERAFQMRRDLLTDYIQGQNGQGFLKNWNVVLMGHTSNENGTEDIGLPDRVNLIRRSRMDMPGIQHANIKSLVSTIDRCADLPQARSEIGEMVGGDITDAKLLDLREQLVGDVGLLCLYPISRDSEPRVEQAQNGKRRRLPLKAEDHVLGACFFFPESRGLLPEVDYFAAKLSDLSVEDLESDTDDIDALDAEDQAAGEAAEQQGK